MNKHISFTAGVINLNNSHEDAYYQNSSTFQMASRTGRNVYFPPRASSKVHPALRQAAFRCRLSFFRFSHPCEWAVLHNVSTLREHQILSRTDTFLDLHGRGAWLGECVHRCNASTIKID
jgi:hypothetical protein